MHDSPRELPWVSLGHLIDTGAVTAVNGFACGDHNADGRGVLQVRPFNVTSNASITLNQEKHVPLDAARGKPSLLDGDILFNNTNTKELVGKTGLWRGPEGCVFSNHMTRLRVVDPTIPPRYLAWAIHAHWLTGRSQMLARSHVAQASILGERFREITVPWPSSDEREAFARVFEALDTSLACAHELSSTAEDLKRAALPALFTRGLRAEPQKHSALGLIPESWDVVTLGSVGRVGNGSTPKKDVKKYWDGGTFPWLTSSKVYDRTIVAADHFVTTHALRECHLPQLGPGTVLIAITGQGKTLGHCAVLNMNATISQHLAYVAIDTSRADPLFVRGYIETQYDYLRQVAAGGGSTKGALTCAFLRELPIPLPSLEEQREVVAVLDAIDSKIDLQKHKRQMLDAVFRSLLTKLMTGDVRLDPTDLSDLSSATSREAAA